MKETQIFKEAYSPNRKAYFALQKRLFIFSEPKARLENQKTNSPLPCKRTTMLSLIKSMNRLKIYIQNLLFTQSLNSFFNMIMTKRIATYWSFGETRCLERDG